MPPRYVAVYGASEATPSQLGAAREVRRLLARSGAVIIGGVMGAASANPHLTLALATGLGQARNAVIVTAADSVIAIGAGWGTLSEIALAQRLDRPVFALDTWKLEGMETVDSPAEAVKRALEQD